MKYKLNCMFRATLNPNLTASLLNAIETRWYGNPGMLWWLLPLSWCWSVVAACRRWWLKHRAQHLPVPVWVVGNLTVGGNGKSQMVQYLVNCLQNAGHHPGIIIRGYGCDAHQKSTVRLATHKSSCSEVGDEALMHARRLSVPIAVAADRVQAGRFLLAQHPEVDVIVADDGLQHYRLARDLEWLVINAQRRLGNQQLLPVGPCRESPYSRLRTVDAIVETGEGSEEESDGFLKAYPAQLFSAADPTQKQDPTVIHNRRIHAVAAIAHPTRFLAMLETLGAIVVPHVYPDHHALTVDEIDIDVEFDEMVILTEKDWVKRPISDYDHRHWVLRLGFEPSPGLVQLVGEKIASLSDDEVGTIIGERS